MKSIVELGKDNCLYFLGVFCKNIKDNQNLKTVVITSKGEKGFYNAHPKSLIDNTYFFAKIPDSSIIKGQAFIDSFPIKHKIIFI